MNVDDILASIGGAAPEYLPAAQAIFQRQRPSRVVTKAGERYAKKSDVAKLLKILDELRILMAGLRSGTKDAAQEMGDGAKQLAERLQRLRVAIRQEDGDNGLSMETFAKMLRGRPTGRSLLPPGRARFDGFVGGIIRKQGTTPLSPGGHHAQRREAPQIDSRALEKGILRALEQRRQKRKSVLGRLSW